MPILLLIGLFILVPLAELYVILQVGEAIGAIPTILLLAADSVLGSLLLRAQGRAVWRRFNSALGDGRVPHREVLDGVMVIFGGAFLITPGFITDFFGLLLLIPPTRALIRRVLTRVLTNRVTVGVAGAAAARRTRGSYDVEGTATEASERPPRRSLER